MAYSLGINSPFVLPPGAGAAEVGARGKLYGSKVRVAKKEGAWKGASEGGLYWAYGKKTWARIGGGAAALGFAGGKINSYGRGNKMGDLALYSPRKHLPKLPLLTGIQTSNEGALGSIVKGSFSFTLYPEISRSSMAMGVIEGAYFKPGKKCNVSFGWSTYAAVACASRFGFLGTIYDFQWSVNADMSVASTVSVITAAAAAVGTPGKQTIAKTATAKQPDASNSAAVAAANQNQKDGKPPAESPTDPKQIPVVGFDMATIIDEVLAEVNPIGGTSGVAGEGQGTSNGSGTQSTEPEAIYGIKRGEVQKVTTNVDTKGLIFVAVGIPWQPDPPETDEVSKTDEAYAASGSAASGSVQPAEDVPKKEDWQVQLDAYKTTVDNAQKPIVKKFYYVNFGSMEKFFNHKDILIRLNEVMKVDIMENKTVNYDWCKSAYPMEVLWDFGGYGSFTINPLGGLQPMAKSGLTNIGGLWFSTDHVKNTWRKFFTENAVKINQKTLTSFLTELCKRANEASGDNWQLSALVVEDFATCGGLSSKRSVLSAEDFNYHPPVGAFRFEASIYRPAIKSVSISCKPPGALATAAMMDGQGGQLETPTPDTKNLQGNPDAALIALDDAISKIGVNNAWSEAYRAALNKKKKLQMESHHSTNGAIYPIDFGITVDGVSGFKFGESVTTNLLPASYAGRAFFTVTKINHSVNPGTWDTTISAVMRMK